jgi:Aspartyl protease
VFRPFVPVSLAFAGRSTPELEGLIDTGADGVLASDLLADALGLDLSENEGEERHAVGGRIVTARYKTVELRLHHHDGNPNQFHQWEALVGFVQGWHSFGLVLLGSVGFLDHFTVTASRFAQAIAVENHDTFDARFGLVEAG